MVKPAKVFCLYFYETSAHAFLFYYLNRIKEKIETKQLKKNKHYSKKVRFLFRTSQSTTLLLHDRRVNILDDHLII